MLLDRTLARLADMVELAGVPGIPGAEVLVRQVRALDASAVLALPTNRAIRLLAEVERQVGTLARTLAWTLARTLDSGAAPR